MSDRAAFLAGDRPDDVLLYFPESGVSGIDALAGVGERVDDGVVLVLDGEQGRRAFENAVGLDPMAFARDAMGTEGTVWADCTGGDCPAAVSGGGHDGDRSGREDGETDGDGNDAAHDARFVFAFAEEQNEAAGGRYADGDVIHAYVACTCGQTYADRWVVGER